MLVLGVILAAPPAIPDEESEELAPADAHDIVDATEARIPATTTFPKYPAAARRDRIEGEATVCFKIAP
ncbi:MAG TPA: hypothetical protein VE175_13910, partial [Woeseiaceae bacterium]|nr:hypothetical protein [Woeseiaceae bacterium]